MAKVDDYLSKQASELLQAVNEGCYKEDNIPCQIKEGLFLGSFGAANNKDELKRLSITHILTVGSVMPPAYPNDFVYKVFNVSDRPSTNIKQRFNECFDYIEEAKRSGASVLIHCFLGRSRSVVVVVAYLLKMHGMTLFQALDHVKSRRARASPNAGFCTQLYEYEMFLSALYVKLVLAQVVCRESSDELKRNLEAAKSNCRSLSSNWCPPITLLRPNPQISGTTCPCSPPPLSLHQTPSSVRSCSATQMVSTAQPSRVTPFFFESKHAVKGATDVTLGMCTNSLTNALTTAL